MAVSRRKRLLICGYYGHHNLGDEAMLAGMLSLLKRYLGANYLDQITVYSHDPEDTVERHGVATLSHQYPRRRREKWLKWIEHSLAIWHHSHFILGGGDLLRDALHREVATVWLSPLQQAMRLGCRTAILGVSVGEVWKPHTKAVIVNTLNKVNLIAVRDQQSRQQLQQIGVTSPINVISDLALQLPFRSGQSTTQAASVLSSPRIGISIRSLTGRVSDLNHSVEHRFYQEIAKVIDHLVKTRDANISLLPFQAYPPGYIATHRPADNDEVAIAAVLAHSHYREQINVCGAFGSVEQAIDSLQTYDVVIGTRLHALILAAGSGVPLLAAAYDKKVSGFMAEIGQMENNIPVQEFTLAAVRPRLDYLLDNREHVRHQITTAVEQYRQRTLSAVDTLNQFLDH